MQGTTTTVFYSVFPRQFNLRGSYERVKRVLWMEAGKEDGGGGLEACGRGESGGNSDARACMKEEELEREEVVWLQWRRRGGV